MKIKKILNYEYLKIKYPINIKRRDKYLFKNDINKKIPNSYCYTFKKILINKNSCPRIFNYAILTDFLKFNSLSKFILIKKLILFFLCLKNFLLMKKPNKFIAKALIVHDRHSENYYHWITDVLPKIIWAKKNKVFKNYKLVIPEFSNKFQIQTIKKITKNYILIDKFTTFEINKLKYLSEFHVSGSPRKIFLNETKKIFINKKKSENEYRKIYISRLNTKRRRLKNEKNFTDLLIQKKFKIIETDKLSFQQQVNIFNNCSTLVSLHGAGLTNLIWLKKNSNIIEIRDKKDITLNPYFVLSQQMGHNYYYHLSEKEHYLNNVFHPDYEINIDKFCKKFSKIINL